MRTLKGLLHTAILNACLAGAQVTLLATYLVQERYGWAALWLAFVVMCGALSIHATKELIVWMNAAVFVGTVGADVVEAAINSTSGTVLVQRSPMGDYHVQAVEP